jgi:hypothetical protein
MHEATQGSSAAPEPQSFVLRLTRGVHRAAVIRLERAGMLVIGSSDDCDVILADAGVASHHCILQKQDNRFLLRAIDGAMRIDAHQHDPGSTIAVRVGASVVIGSATFEIIPESSLAAPPEGVCEAAAEPAHVASRPRRAILTSVPLPMIASDEFEAGSQHSLLARLMRKSGLSVWLVAAAAVAMVLAAVLLALEFAGRTAQTAVTQPALPAQATPRSGDSIAHDVAEVLRLSGIACEARYSDDGTVTVSGHLGDPQQLSAVIKSRAMHEIVGLKRVAVSNVDHSGDPDQGLPIDGTRIVSVVASADPYVVTADGSRYYVGASLPQGGRLAGVREGEVLVERDGHTEHWKLTNRTRESGEYRPTVNLQ